MPNDVTPEQIEEVIASIEFTTEELSKAVRIAMGKERAVIMAEVRRRWDSARVTYARTGGTNSAAVMSELIEIERFIVARELAVEEALKTGARADDGTKAP